jgi:hypothetical protein
VLTGDSHTRKGATMMQSFLTPKAKSPVPETLISTEPAVMNPAGEHPDGDIVMNETTTVLPINHIHDEIFTGYLSDQSNGEFLPAEDNKNDADNEGGIKDITSLSMVKSTSVPVVNTPDRVHNVSHPLFRVNAAPSLKRRKLDVPVRVARKKAKERRGIVLSKALEDIDKLIRSRRGIFQAGRTGLQAYRARAIKSYLHMVVNNQ